VFFLEQDVLKSVAVGISVSIMSMTEFDQMKMTVVN